MVERGTNDNHRFTLGVMGVLCELTRHLNHQLWFNGGVLLLPGWRVRDVLVVA